MFEGEGTADDGWPHERSKAVTGLMRQLVCGSDLARSYLIGIFRALVFMLDNLSSELSQLFNCLLTDQFEQVLEDCVKS